MSRTVYGRARFGGIGAAWPLLWPRHGVYLGTMHGRALIDPGPTHTLVVAPTRAGKGVGFVVPQLLTWPHACLAFDPKGELCGLTAAWRERHQPTAYWGPSRYSARWSPTHELAALTDADRAAQARTIAATLAGEGDQSFWTREATGLLEWLLVYAATRPTPAPLAAVHDLLQTMDDEALERIAGDDAPGAVTRGAADLAAKSAPERSGVRSTALSFLRSWSDLRVREATSALDVRVADWFAAARTLYVVATPQDLTAHGGVMRVFWRYWLEYAMSGEPLPQPTLCLLDEFSFLAESPVWDTVLKFGAGFGLRMAMVCQSLAQVDKELVANTYNRLFFATSDLDTAKFLSEYAGQRTAKLDKDHLVAETILQATDARKSRPLLLRGTADPMRVSLPPYFRGHLRRRIGQRSVPQLQPAELPELGHFFPALDAGGTPAAAPVPHLPQARGDRAAAAVLSTAELDRDPDAALAELEALLSGEASE